MAISTITLSANFTPAYSALIDVAREIAEAHGEDRAMAFVKAAFDADFDAFCVLKAGAEKPRLRLVHSAA